MLLSATISALVVWPVFALGFAGMLTLLNEQPHPKMVQAREPVFWVRCPAPIPVEYRKYSHPPRRLHIDMRGTNVNDRRPTWQPIEHNPRYPSRGLRVL